MERRFAAFRKTRGSADDCRSIKEKYRLGYRGTTAFKMGLITTNFYDEITRPQQRGLLAFCDYVYLTKAGRYAPPMLNFWDLYT